LHEYTREQKEVRQDLIGEIILEFRTESLSYHSCKLYVIDICRKCEREIRHLFCSIVVDAVVAMIEG